MVKFSSGILLVIVLAIASGIFLVVFTHTNNETQTESNFKLKKLDNQSKSNIKTNFYINNNINNSLVLNKVKFPTKSSNDGLKSKINEILKTHIATTVEDRLLQDKINELLTNGISVSIDNKFVNPTIQNKQVVTNTLKFSTELNNESKGSSCINKTFTPRCDIYYYVKFWRHEFNKPSDCFISPVRSYYNPKQPNNSKYLLFHPDEGGNHISLISIYLFDYICVS